MFGDSMHLIHYKSFKARESHYFLSPIHDPEATDEFPFIKATLKILQIGRFSQ